MSARVLIALTEKVREAVTGFEICTLDETDAADHPKLLAIAVRREDARLFAAAPDLLAALENLMGPSGHLRTRMASCPSGPDCSEYAEHCAAARAAIAKAGK